LRTSNITLEGGLPEVIIHVRGEKKGERVDKGEKVFGSHFPVCERNSQSRETPQKGKKNELGRPAK